MVVRLVQIVDIHRVANKKEVVMIINNTGFDIFKKHDNLTVDGVDFWSPHPHNKGGMRIYWSSDKGFGNLDIVKKSGFTRYGTVDKDEELILNVYSEGMVSIDNKEFIQRIMRLFVEKLNIID